MATQQQAQTGSGQARAPKRKWSSARFMVRAYGGSLVVTSMAIPIFASVATVCLYLALPFASSRWYAPAGGLLATVILWLLFALLRSHFATAKGANMHVYELLRNRHAELKARLGMPDTLDNKDTKDYLCAMQKTFNIDDSASYHIEALRKAYEAYHDLTKNLFYNHSATEWTLGTGYINAWRMVHRTQEALVTVETLQEVIGDVIHDIRSIQSSAMSDSKALIRKTLQAVKDICPEAMVYFEELQGDKYYVDLFGKNEQGQSHPPKEIAIEAIRQVKYTLNTYQDHLRDI
jgi:virulence-associated protein VapD